MLLKIKKRSDICSSEITPEPIYHDRRRFMQQSGRVAMAGLGLMLAGCSQEGEAISQKAQVDTMPSQPGPQWLKKQVLEFTPNVYTTNEVLTPHKDVTTYNNG
ncbi:hypothetical protein [Endozoicomonas sp. SCSIO W0465]|uniref:hypothetical protein n=1 Tax=Endozoicomonas sp. SCSIO W0465 TaxID=2918516 RepID=UPI00207639A7|nr:hypothetical protein [Endozoicomonas sp. SCSIO W0465]USE36274.1 hypothetical protein MJO57_30305 [Endozoicomonas sp. SCSIO W0465]